MEAWLYKGFVIVGLGFLILLGIIHKSDHQQQRPAVRKHIKALSFVEPNDESELKSPGERSAKAPLTNTSARLNNEADEKNKTSNRPTVLDGEAERAMEIKFLKKDIKGGTKDTTHADSKAFGESWRRRRKKSLTVVAMGVGTTATHGLYRDLCQLGVRTIHYKLFCNLPDEDVDGGSEAQKKMLALIGSTATTNRFGAPKGKDTQPTTLSTTSGNMVYSEWLKTFLPKYIAELAAAPSIEAFMDCPFPEISGELITELLEEKRRERVKLILTQREVDAWIRRRIGGHANTPTCCNLPQKSLGNDASPWSLLQCASNGHPICPLGALSEQALKQTYVDHNDWLVKFARSKGLDLLVVNYFEDSAQMDKIGKFLGIM